MSSIFMNNVDTLPSSKNGVSYYSMLTYNNQLVRGSSFYQVKHARIRYVPLIM